VSLRAAMAAFILGASTGMAAAPLACASAESMDGLMAGWTRGFTALHPETPATVTLRTKFSAEAFDALLRGDVQVAPFARELFPAERTRYVTHFGVEPVLVPVATGSRATKGATHAIAIFVNAENPLSHLTLPQLRALLTRDGTITTWGQLGLGGDWAARKIVVHGMLRRRDTGNPPGIVNFLEQHLLAGGAWREDIHEHADLPGGPQALEQIVRAVAADEAALGYSGFGYAVPGTKTLALAETEAGPFFAGTSEEVAGQDYPLARKIYLCLPRESGTVARDFVRYVLSAAGQQVVAEDAQKFFPLPAVSPPSATQ
jgi:phosphate transport system substrate-binding protein